MTRRLVRVLLAALLLAGCGQTHTVSGTAGGPIVAVYAAASLKGAMAAAKSAYEAAHPGTTVVISADSSSALEAKLEQGAPADVFLSADTTNPQKIVDKGLADGAVVPFAGNRLVVIVPTANPAGITAASDLAKPGVKVIGAGDAVPVTKYANQLVTNLSKTSGYAPDFADRYAANIVSKEDNVAAVLAKIELGEGDAAIVYVTDAKSSSKVHAVDVPAAANVPATYGGVVLASSPNNFGGRSFMAWLTGPAGQSTLASFGFLPPP